MSEQDNTRLVQRCYERIKAGDIPGFLEMLAQDVQWRLPQMETVPFAGIWHGHEGVERFFGTLAAVQDVIAFEPRQYLAQGDTVIVLGNFVMRVKAGGEFASDWAHVWTIQDGMVRDFYEYVDTAVVSKAHATATKKSLAGSDERAASPHALARDRDLASAIEHERDRPGQ